MKILFVEDDVKVTEGFQELCQYQGIDCDTANNGEEGLKLATRPSYDLIILDQMLPGLTGSEILQIVRDKGLTVPIMMLTAKGTIDDKVEALDLGADDYLVKPIKATELFARIRALLRRLDTERKTESITYGDVTFYPDRLVVEIKGKEYNLQLKDARILEMLIKKPGYVFSKEQLFKSVWGIKSDINLNNLEIHIHQVRKVLQNSNVKIDTVRGIGYMLTLKK